MGIRVQCIKITLIKGGRLLITFAQFKDETGIIEMVDLEKTGFVVGSEYTINISII